MRFICEKCDRKFNRKQNLELHIKTCKGKKKEEVIDNSSKNKKCMGTKKVECEHSETGLHDLIILRGVNIMQVKAIENGYTAFCRICGELT